MPAELGELSNLRILSLWGNQLSGEIPASFGNLEQLEELSLFLNSLSGDFPPELATLSNLRELSIAGNELNGCLPDELKHVPLNDFGESGLPFCGDVRASPDRQALELLYFATDGPNWTNNRNWLSDRPVREWEGVNTNAAARVTELNLAENGLDGEIPVEISSLTAMRSLVLWNNRLSGSGLSISKNFTSAVTN